MNGNNRPKRGGSVLSRQMTTMTMMTYCLKRNRVDDEAAARRRSERKKRKKNATNDSYDFMRTIIIIY